MLYFGQFTHFQRFFWFKMISFLFSKLYGKNISNRAFSQNCFLTRQNFGHYVSFCLFVCLFVCLFLFCCFFQTSKDGKKMVEELNFVSVVDLSFDDRIKILQF